MLGLVAVYTHFMKVLCFFVALITLSSTPLKADVMDQFEPERLLENFKQMDLCGTERASMVCRQLAWAPGANEGVLELGTRAYVFLRWDAQPDSLKKFLAFYPADKLHEYAFVAALTYSNLNSVILKTNYSAYYFIWVEVTEGEMKPLSVFHISRQALTELLSGKVPQIKTELELLTAPWVPSIGLLPPYDFKKF